MGFIESASVKRSKGAARAAARRGLSWWLGRDSVFKWIPYILVQGWFLFLTIPFLLLVYLSLVSWRVTRGPWWAADFAGLENFIQAFQDDRFLWAVGRTLLFAGIAVPLEFGLGLALALLAYEEFPGRKFYATVLLVPMMIVPVVVGYDLSMLLIDTGPLNELLSRMAGRPINIGWLSDPMAAQVAVIGADVWQWTPLMFLMLFSGLAALPKDLIRAARIMGASTWQIFARIQLPLLKPVITIALVIRTMEALKMFDYPMLLTQGGPGNATETISIYLFRMGWEYIRVSEAAAMSVILLVVIAMYVLIALKFIRRERRALEARG